MMSMKNIRYRLYNVIVITFILITSCKPARNVQKDFADSIPDSYSMASDSISSGGINWKVFFSDRILLGLIDTALKNNHDMLSAMQRIEVTRARIRSAKGALLPSAGLSAAYNQRKFGLYTMDGAGNETTQIEGDKPIPVHLPDYFTGLVTTWELDFWGKLRNKKVSALSRYMASVEGRNLVITNLVSDICNAYYELLSLDAQARIVKETIALQKRALEMTEVQKEAAAANQLAVEQFEIRLLNSMGLEKGIDQEILETENRINFLLGRYPQPIPRDSSSFLAAPPVKARVGIPSDLLRYRPDIRQAEYELVASKADVRSAKASFLPSFTITGAYGFQAYKRSVLFTTPESLAYNILGGLSAPLINRNAIKAAFDGAKASQREALYNYQKSILNAYIEVSNEIANIRNLEYLYSFKTQEVEKAIKSIETSLALFHSRRATYLEVILAQRNALETKLQLVDLKRDQLNSAVNLYKALGGGWIPE